MTNIPRIRFKHRALADLRTEVLTEDGRRKLRRSPGQTPDDRQN